MFNAVILHHLAENPHLIYAILSAHKTFEDLGTFTLSRGLREIKRVQVAKEEQARKLEGRAKSPRASGESHEPHEEKARLLESEGSAHVDESDSADISGSQRAEASPSPSAGPTTQPVVSPTADGIPTADSIAAAISEKARGKMKELRSSSLDNSLDRVAAAGVGRNGFVPTQEWVCFACTAGYLSLDALL